MNSFEASLSSHVMVDRESYRKVVLDYIQNAKKTIDIEVYIFEWDAWGKVVWRALEEAHLRGVKVRLAIDGFGSRDLHLLLLEQSITAPFDIRIYNPFPSAAQILFKVMSIQVRWIAKKNKRNHKKTFIFDESCAIIGSRNIFDEALDWIEASVLVDSSDVPAVLRSFEWSWIRSHELMERKRVRFSQNRASELKDFYDDNQNVLVNHSRSLKLLQREILKSQFAKAKHSVAIITPYFNPPQALLKILKHLSLSGVAVEIFLPRHSDLRISQLMNRSFYPFLLRHGVQVYEVGQTILHAKITVIDSEVIVGSSNYNYRSFRQDLELDYILRKGVDRNLSLLLQKFRSEGEKVRPSSWIGQMGLRLTRVLTFFIRRTI